MRSGLQDAKLSISLVAASTICVCYWEFDEKKEEAISSQLFAVDDMIYISKVILLASAHTIVNLASPPKFGCFCYRLLSSRARYAISK